MEGLVPHQPKTELAELLTLVEVAGLCRVSVRSVRRWIAAGELTAHRLGRRIRISATDLERFLKASRT